MERDELKSESNDLKRKLDERNAMIEKIEEEVGWAVVVAAVVVVVVWSDEVSQLAQVQKVKTVFREQQTKALDEKNAQLDICQRKIHDLELRAKILEESNDQLEREKLEAAENCKKARDELITCQVEVRQASEWSGYISHTHAPRTMLSAGTMRARDAYTTDGARQAEGHRRGEDVPSEESLGGIVNLECTNYIARACFFFISSSRIVFAFSHRRVVFSFLLRIHLKFPTDQKMTKELKIKTGVVKR